MTIKVTYNITDVYMSQSVSPVYITVSYAEGGAGGGAVWGAITGTLSNQTDLQNALNAKLDESTIDGGAEGQILSKASATDFDFAWINNYAKYLATNVRNQTGSTIGAFQVVYISGATGNKPLISLADADTEATSSKTYGVTSTSIANNGTGDVVTVGELSGIDTSAFTEGDSLWLSSTAGGVVTSPPAEPAHAVFIGTVIRSHPTLGVIDVAIQNGYELTELHGVEITTPTANQGLFYDGSLWVNRSITTALGYTPVPTTRNITINGVTYDLSADRTWTVAAGISGSGASGQVTYWTGASAVSGSNNLFWDATNNRLGIGTNAPATVLQLGSSASRLRFNETVGGSIFHGIEFATNGVVYSSLLGNQNTGEIRLSTVASYFPTFYSSGAEAMRISTQRNLLIGFTTDQATRLAVSGDTLLRGSGNTSATTALTVQNSGSTDALKVRNDGVVILGSSTFAGSPSLFPHDRLSPQSLNIAGTGLSFNSPISGQSGTRFSFGSQFTSGNASGTNRQILSEYNITDATGGTATYTNLTLSGTISQTNGSNGITRGLYVNPTLTAAADWRSIEWSNNSGWGLYGAGTAPNMLLGPLTIGEQTVGTNVLNIRANLTGGTIYNSVRVASLALSDVTNIASAFRSEMGTQNAVFTLNTLAHFHARQGSFGASSTVTNQYGFWAVSTLIGAINNYGFYGDIASGTGRWNLYMNGTADNYLNGNLGIGITPTVRLHVSGDTILRGSGATSATTALTVQDSAGVDMLIIRNDGVLRIVKRYINTSQDQNVGFGASNDGSVYNAAGLGHLFSTANRTSAGVNYAFFGGNITNTTGAFYHLRTTGVPNFAPTSGTGTFFIASLEATINQTGGANGITRGLYVNPTLTSAADFRAIETARGNIVFGNLPTSSAGLPTGALWNDAGTVKIV